MRISFAGRFLGRVAARRSGRATARVRLPERTAGVYFLRARSRGRSARSALRLVALRRAPGPGTAPTEPDPAPTQSPPPSGTARLVAAGDIACRPGAPEEAQRCRHARTADRVLALAPDVVATLGDAQYQNGTPEEYAGSFEPTWGRFRGLIRPAVGNHEYSYDQASHSNAAGHFGYFGGAAGDPSQGYYSYELGSWQVIVLNSGDIAWTRNRAELANDCWPVSCAVGSVQEAWLRATLAERPAGGCVLAYWHHPRYSSGTPFDYAETAALYDALHDHGAEVVLAGHSHHYERFAPMDAAGAADPVTGVRSFVVGTGGSRLFVAPDALRAGSELYDNAHFGVLELSLAADTYAWRFVDELGTTIDSGLGACHGAPGS